MPERFFRGFDNFQSFAKHMLSWALNSAGVGATEGTPAVLPGCLPLANSHFVGMGSEPAPFLGKGKGHTSQGHPRRFLRVPFDKGDLWVWSPGVFIQPATAKGTQAKGHFFWSPKNRAVI